MSSSSSSSSDNSGSSSESETETPPQAKPSNSPQKKQPLRYRIPAGFSEVDVSNEGITKDDLSDDDEFFLVKMPLDFDPSMLHGRTISFDDRTEIPNPEPKPSNGLPFVFNVEVKSHEVRGETYSVLMPTKTGQLQPVGNFQGEVTVKKQLQLPTKVKIPKATPKGYALPEGLQQRYIPFGAGKQLPEKRRLDSDAESPRKKKAKLDMTDGIDKNGNQVLENGKSKKKKKHKSKEAPEHEQDITSGADTDISLLDSSQTKKKKKDKKKERSSDKSVIEGALDSTETEEQMSQSVNTSGLNGLTTDDSVVEFTAIKKKKKKKDKHKDEESQNSTMETDVSVADLSDSKKEKKEKKKNKHKDEESQNTTMETDESIADLSNSKKEKKEKKKKRKERDSDVSVLDTPSKSRKDNDSVISIDVSISHTPNKTKKKKKKSKEHKE